MNIRLLIASLLLMAGISFAQEYPLVTIQDIQNVPDSLAGTDPASLLNGDTVRVQGIVLVRPVIDSDTNRRVIISAGPRWVTYVQDPNNPVYGGLNILQEDTSSGPQVYETLFDVIDTAQVWEFTGVVTEYFTTTEMLLLIRPESAKFISAAPKRPDPVELQVSDMFTENGQYNFDMEKYENVYVIFRNVFTSDREANGEFRINDQDGNFVNIYNQSRYFKSGSAGEVGWEAPNDGTYLSYVRGILTTRTDGYYLVPVYPEDVGPTLVSPPTISTIRRSPVEIGPNQAVTVTAKITDFDGSVASAQIHYSVNGGARDSVEMTSTDSIFIGVIPGVADSALVDFYISARDNQGNVSANPSNPSSNYFYLVLNRPLTIKDVQYSPFGSGFSAYNGYRVTVSGVVTSDTSGLAGRTGNASNRVIIQDGEGPWSGIWLNAVNTPANIYGLKLGDHVTLSGVVQEDFSFTRLDSIQNLTVNSSGNQLPAPQVLTTGSIGTKASSVVEAEQWESVLIKYENITVTDYNADGGSSNFGEMFVDDGSGQTRVELQDGNHFYHNLWDSTLLANPNFINITDSSTFTGLAGYLYFSFSNYKLIPRYNSDFEGFDDPTSVENDVKVPAKFVVNQNYPNPFNPSTVISYSIPKEGLVTVKIYNVLGQEVKTLVNQFQSAGSYKINFDASELSTGVYFYSVKAGDFNQVKKMVLVK